MTALLEVTGLTKHFGAVRAVDGVGLTLQAGAVAALIGPNGAGKSSLFNLLTGQLRPDRGTVYLAGEALQGRPPEAIFHRGIGRTFQVARLFPSMTVAENVQLALISRAGRSWRGWRPAAGYWRESVMARLQRLDLAGAADRLAGELPYGERKRVELAIALANDPRLLLLDEPTAGLARGERRALMAALTDLAAEGGPAVLFTEHDMEAVFDHAQRVLVLDRGRLIADGDPASVRADSRVQAVYLGEDVPAEGENA